MLVIRFQRIGKKNQAAFRVVLQEKARKPQGKIKELLGFYNPHSKEKKFQADRIKFWLAKGAQLSPTVHNLLVDADLIEASKVKAWRPKKKKTEEKVEAKAAPPVGAKAEPPKEESKAEESPEPKPEPAPSEAPVDQKEAAAA